MCSRSFPYHNLKWSEIWHSMNATLPIGRVSCKEYQHERDAGSETGDAQTGTDAPGLPQLAGAGSAERTGVCRIPGAVGDGGGAGTPGKPTAAQNESGWLSLRGDHGTI